MSVWPVMANLNGFKVGSDSSKTGFYTIVIGPKGPNSVGYPSPNEAMRKVVFLRFFRK